MLESERFVKTEVKDRQGHRITFFTVRYAHIATRMADIFGGIKTAPNPDRLERIANRKRALQRMARLHARLVSKQKALVGGG